MIRMYNPLISVIIPTYNRSKYLNRSISSVINQTYKNFEIIIVDDGSTDNTQELITKIMNENQRFKIKYKKLIKNEGSQKARNEGIKISEGEWIAFLDSDDEWLSEKIEKQIKFAIEKKFKVIYSDGLIIRNDKSKVRMNIQNVQGDSFGLLLKKAGPLFPTLFVHNECLQKIGFLDESIRSHQEWDFSIQLAKYYNFGFIDEPLFVWYYDGHESISQNKKFGAEGYAQIVEKYKNDILNIHGKSVLRHHYMRIASAYYYADDFSNCSKYYNFSKNYANNYFERIINNIQSQKVFMKVINPKYWNIKKIYEQI